MWASDFALTRPIPRLLYFRTEARYRGGHDEPVHVHEDSAAHAQPGAAASAHLARPAVGCHLGRHAQRSGLPQGDARQGKCFSLFHVTTFTIRS